MAKHVNPTSRDRTSLAPYNFIALPKAVRSVAEGVRVGGEEVQMPWRAHDRYLEGAHSGWLDLHLTAETPLYVRCAPPAEHAANEETRTNRHRQDFFHHGDPGEPVIPGSSLRGMARSLVEILGFGAFRWFSDRQLVYRAVGDMSNLGDDYRDRFTGTGAPSAGSGAGGESGSRVRGGYLRQRGGDWFIQPAKAPRGQSVVRVEEGAARDGANIRLRPKNDRSNYGRQDVTDVWLRPPDPGERGGRLQKAEDLRRRADGEEAPAEGFVPATVVRSGSAPKKHTCFAIYEPDADAEWIEIPHDLWKLYEDDRELTRGIPTRKLRDPGDPLFYLLDDRGKLIFFGPTLMFRLPYRCKISDFVPSQLRDPATFDLAEAIFGTVDRKPAIKGRVFFEDALWQRGEGQEHPFLEVGDRGLRSPQILSGPKPTSFQHYLAQPAPDNKKTLKHWASDPSETEIRGHKRYWHKPQIGQEDPFEAELKDDTQKDATQHTIIRPVRKGTRFTGRVRFENLSDLELGALLTALDLPASKRHHVGMGKPLGMGSTRIEVALHLVDRARRYARLVTEDGVTETGEIEASQAQTVAARCRGTFEAAILEHAIGSGEVEKKLGSLWEIPRLAELGLMLEWDQAPSMDKTGYRPADSKEKFPRFWKERAVLPDPHGVLHPPKPGSEQPPQPPATPKADPVKPGVQVQVVVLEEKTKKGGWKFQVQGSEIKAVLHPQSPEPPDLAPGKELRLQVKTGGATPQLLWTEEE